MHKDSDKEMRGACECLIQEILLGIIEKKYYHMYTHAHVHVRELFFSVSQNRLLLMRNLSI